MSALVTSSLYEICKGDVLRYVSRICKLTNSKQDYTQFVMSLLDDFFSQYRNHIHEKKDFMRYLEAVSLAGVWIIDKYIEDDHMYIEDILELNNSSISRSLVLKAEQDIYGVCKQISKYIPNKTRSITL